MYKLVNDPKSGDLIGVRVNLDGEGVNEMFIPSDPANTDYQAYLKWLEDGNTPLPADQGAQQ